MPRNSSIGILVLVVIALTWQNSAITLRYEVEGLCGLTTKRTTSKLQDNTHDTCSSTCTSTYGNEIILEIQSQHCSSR
jgi:hypothetical protein